MGSPAKQTDFMFDGMPVGSFEQIPQSPGRYRYEPYRSVGHYQMQTLLTSGGSPRCYYDANAERVTFSIRACPEYGVLELGDFLTIPQ